MEISKLIFFIIYYCIFIFIIYYCPFLPFSIYIYKALFLLNRSGHTENDTPLYLTKYLEKEDEILIWNLVLKKIEITDSMNILSDYELYPVLKVCTFFYLMKCIPLIWVAIIWAASNVTWLIQVLKMCVEKWLNSVWSCEKVRCEWVLQGSQGTDARIFMFNFNYVGCYNSLSFLQFFNSICINIFRTQLRRISWGIAKESRGGTHILPPVPLPPKFSPILVAWACWLFLLPSFSPPLIHSQHSQCHAEQSFSFPNPVS